MAKQSILTETKKAITALERKIQVILQKAMIPHLGHLSTSQETLAKARKAVESAKVRVEKASRDLLGLELAMKAAEQESEKQLFQTSIDKAQLEIQSAQKALNTATASKESAEAGLAAVRKSFAVELDLFDSLVALRQAVERDEERIIQEDKPVTSTK